MDLAPACGLCRVDFEMELAGTIYDAIPVLHNGYLYVLIKEGIFGLVSFVGFFYLTFRKIKKIKTSQINKELGIIILMIISVNAFVVGGVMQTGGLMFMFILGLLSGTSKHSVLSENLNSKNIVVNIG